MWGVAGNKKAAETNQQRHRSAAFEDLASPRWEQRHPTWVFVLSVFQTAFLCLALYFCIYPQTQHSQVVAVVNDLELSQFGRDIIECSSEESFICSYSKIKYAPNSSATFYQEIKTMQEAFLWLHDVVAVLYQGAFFGNFNQIYMMELKLEQSPLINEANTNYQALLGQNLGKQPWSVTKTHKKQYFRTAAENPQKDLNALLDDGWFDSTTKHISVMLKLFNGFTGTWIKLMYTFDQSTVGGILKDKRVTTAHLTLTDDPEVLFALLFLWVFVLVTLWEPISEGLIIRRMIHNMDVMARSQAGSEVQLYYKEYAIHYLYNRGLVMVIKILKLIFVMFILYRMLKYPIGGPYQLLTASRNGNDGVPESSTIGRSFTFFVILGGLIIILMCVYSLALVQKIHSDLGVVTKTIKNFISVFYGCFMIFVLIWFSWALSNHLLFGSEFEDFFSFSSSLIFSFRFFFGERYEKYHIDDPREPSGSFQFVFMQLACHIMTIPICVAAVSHFYAFSETQRVVQYGSEKTGHWVRRKCRHGCERRCFCFTPDPTEIFQLEGDDDKNDKAGNKLLDPLSKGLSNHESKSTKIPVQETIAVSASSVVAAKWKRRSMAIYIVFLGPFVAGVIILLNQSTEFNYFRATQTTVITEPFLQHPSVPDYPYTNSEDLLPNRDDVVIDPELKYPLTLLDVTHPTSVETWILDILISRVDEIAVPSIFGGDVQLGDRAPDEGSVSTTYVHLSAHGGPPPHTYVLELYYGPTDIVYKQAVEALKRFQVFGWKTRQITTNWIEFNGDGRMFILNSVTIKILTSGDLNTSYFVDIFPESSDPEVYVDRKKSPVDFFVSGALPMLLVSCLVFFLFFSVQAWAIFTRRIKIAIIQFLLDLFLLSYSIFLLIEMSQLLIPTFEPLAAQLEVPDTTLPVPSSSQIPGPSILHPITGGVPTSSSIFNPSASRTLRLLNEANTLKNYKTSLHAFSSYAALAALFRFPMFFFGFPGTIFVTLHQIYGHVRWKINMLVFVFFLIGLTMFAVQHICLGSQVAGLSTPQASIISGWLIVTAKWNLQYTDQIYAAAYFLVQALFVILWVFILNNLILAALVYGLRTVNSERHSHLKVELYQTWNLKPREKNVIRSNQRVLAYWNAVGKALQKQKRKTDNDGEFARQVDYFFLRFRTSMLFTRAPRNVEGYLRRSIQAHNLTRVQQYITDILLIECKRHLVQEDLDNIKEMTSRASKTTQGKSKYIRTLEKKLEAAREKLALLKDNLAFMEADFRPDVTQLAKDSTEPEGRYVPENDVQRGIEMERLEKKREERRKRMDAKRQAQRQELEEGPKQEIKDPFAEDTHTGRRIGGTREKEEVTAFGFVDKERERRKAKSGKMGGGDSDSDDEWAEARRGLLSASPKQEPSVSPSPSVQDKPPEEKKEKKKKKGKEKSRHRSKTPKPPPEDEDDVYKFL